MKFTRNTPVIEVIEYGKQLLKDVGYVPARYKCRLADAAILEVSETDEGMTVGQFANEARDREDWAILCTYCLIVPEFEAILSRGLQRSFLACAGFHKETSSVLSIIFGESFPSGDPDCQRITSNVDPEIIDKYQHEGRELQERKRGFKWQ